MSRRIGIRVSFTLLLLVFALMGGVFFMKNALAATGQLYLTPASASVQNGSNLSIAVRVTPGTNTDTVNATVGYDPSKLKYVSTDYAGSPYNTQVGASSTTNSISFTSTELSGTPVSSDSLVATVVFTALAGSGTTALTLSGNAANAGTPTNPSVSGTTVTLTSSSTGGGGGANSGNGNGNGYGAGGKHPPPSTTSGTGTTTTSGATTAVGTPATVTTTTAQYTQVSLNLATSTPSQVYVRYGIDGQLTSTTSVDQYATTHNVTLDPTTLVPGQTYSYVVVSTDQQGHVSQSAAQNFKTKGLSVTFGVFDKNNQPLSGKTVTLHSTPQTATVDKNGYVTFENVSPGTHHLIYSSGKQTYDKPVTVANNVESSGTIQTAAMQHFSVVYGFTQSNMHEGFWLGVGTAVLILVVVFGLFRAGRLGVVVQLRQSASGAPLVTQPIVVGNARKSNVGMNNVSSGSSGQTSPDVQDQLNAIPEPQQPKPGSTVAPQSNEVSESETAKKINVE